MTAQKPLEIWLPREWLMDMLEESLRSIERNMGPLDLTDEDKVRTEALIRQREEFLAELKEDRDGASAEITGTS